MALELKRKRNRLAYRPSDTILAPLLKEFEDLLNDNVLSPSGQEPTAGETLFWSDTGTMTGLELGASGTLWRSNGTAPAYSTFTIPDTCTLGDLLIASATNTWTSLAIGTASPAQVLGVSAGLPAWLTASTYLAHDLLSATHSDTTAAAEADGALIMGINGSWRRFVTSAADGALLYSLPSDGTVGGVWLEMSATTGALLMRSASALPSWVTTLTGTYTLSAANALTLSALTPTHVLYAGTGGLVSGDAGLTFNASTDALTVAGFLRVGTAIDAVVQGELAAGLSGAQRMRYQITGTEASLLLYSGDGTLSWTIRATNVDNVLTSNGTIMMLSSGGTTTDVRVNYNYGGGSGGFRVYDGGTNLVHTFPTQAAGVVVINEQGTDLDTRIEGDTNANLFVCDAGLDALGFGTTASSDRLLNILRNWTVTSGTRYGAVLASQSTGLAANSTAALVAMQYDAVHSTAFNLSSIIGSVSTARDTAGFSTGTLTALEAARVDGIHIGAGAITDAFGIRVIQTVSGAGTVGTWTQCLLTDLTGGTVTNRIGFRQQGTNAPSRFQAGMSIGADAAMTTNFICTVTGDMNIASGGLNVGGTTNVGTGEGIFTANLAVGKTTVAVNPLDVTGKAYITGEVEIDGDLNHDGTNLGFYGVAPVPRPAAYTITNDSTDRTLDADTPTVSDVADVLATVMRDLASQGLLQIA